MPTVGPPAPPVPTGVSRAYVATVAIAGGALLALAGRQLPAAWQALPGSARSACVLLAVLLVAAELRPISVHRRGGVDAVTLSGAFACALLLVADWRIALVVQALASLADDLHTRTAWFKSAFNVGQYAVALAAAAQVLRLTDGQPQLGTAAGAAVALTACLVFFVLNTGLPGVAISLHERAGVVRSLLTELPFQASTSGVVVAVAPIVAVVAGVNLWLVALLVLPVAAVQRGARAALARMHMARHDPLTGLLNQVAFRSALREQLEQAETEGRHVAVLVMSVDHFTDVVHTLGQRAGDDLIRQVAERLRTAAVPEAAVARGDGGSFLVSVPQLHSPAEANAHAEALQRRFSAPYAIAESEFTLRASVGVTLSPLHGTDADLLVQHAEVARDVARRTSSALEVYSPARNEFTDRRLTLIGGLGPALRRREMQVHFQPQVDLTTGLVNGYEALLRWNHPTLGAVPPDEFVALAEHAGAMQAITEYVLDEALCRVAEWRAQGFTPRVSVNVSASVLQDAELPGRVARRLAIWGVPSSALVLELTETAVMSDPERCRQVMEGLRELQVGLSLDDYGTGYASLTSLTTLPIDELKIDKCFVMGMVGSRTDRLVVRSTLQLARELGLRVVAEGVETEELARMLASYGCQTAQGYHYGRAVPPHEVVLPDAGPSQTLVLPV